MADLRAEIEATRRVTRDCTRQLGMLDAATHRMQGETAPLAADLPAPPPSPVQNTVVAPVASPVPVLDPTPGGVTWQAQEDRQAELDAIRARNIQSSFDERADVATRRLDDMPVEQRENAMRIIRHVTAMRTMSCIGLAIMNGDDMNAESVTMQLATTLNTPFTPNTP